MTSLSSVRPEEQVKRQSAKGKRQKAKPQESPLSRKVVLGVILLPFALCVLPFDFFLALLLPFAICDLPFDFLFRVVSAEA
jgi:hypothetical protein